MKNFPLIIVIIFLFFIGAWPLALALSILLFFKIKNNREKQEPPIQTIEALKKESEVLRKELGEQAVRHALDKVENREKNP